MQRSPNSRDEFQERTRLGLKTGKNRAQVVAAEVPVNDLAEHGSVAALHARFLERDERCSSLTKRVFRPSLNGQLSAPLNV